FIRNIMRDNMLVNPSGHDGHAMPIDLNIEHLIGYLKILLAAKGLQSTWDRLGNISAAIDYLQKAKKIVAQEMSTAYQNTTHTTPDTSHLVWRTANKARDCGLQVFTQNREGNHRGKLVTDILAEGEAKLKSSSLATFNKKVKAMVNGRRFDIDEDPEEGIELEDDVDELPVMSLSRAIPDVDKEEQ
ncbi:hypothetical protein BYT27DRAFT_7109579, partial [Phlegmacium glaucopus]